VINILITMILLYFTNTFQQTENCC